MGSPWNERRTEDDELNKDRPGAPQVKPGLAAAELDLLRQAPDYDAEEMATVRPSGGWPSPASPPETLEGPAAPAWLPPNRIEPPSRSSAPVETLPRTAAPVESMAAPAAGSLRMRFPEERTVALLAEDLLGRALDEAAPAPARPATGQPAGQPPPTSAGAGFSPNAGANRGGADVWDAAMPLVAEG